MDIPEYMTAAVLTGHGGPEKIRVLVDPWLRDALEPGNRNLAGYLGSERNGGYAQYTVVPG